MLLLPFSLGRADHSIALWDHDEKDVEGNPETIAGAQYAVTALGIDLNEAPQPWPLLAEKTVPLIAGEPPQPVDWRQVLRDAGVPQGTIDALGQCYRADTIDDILADEDLAGGGSFLLWARVNDPAGNWSEWTVAEGPIVLPDTLPPAAPTVLNCHGCPR
jgi:hypothetical protein